MATWRSSPGLALRGTLLLMVCCALQEPSAAKECGDGFYKAAEGVCCRLCPAGTFKVVDCIADGMRAFCDLCPKDTFMDRDNQEGKCSWCSSCGSGEHVVVNCSLAQDTVCRCTEGLKRDGDSGICLPEWPHPDATSVVLFTIFVFVLTGLLLCIVYLNMKLKGSTFKKMLKRSGRQRDASSARQREGDAAHGGAGDGEGTTQAQAILGGAVWDLRDCYADLENVFDKF